MCVCVISAHLYSGSKRVFFTHISGVVENLEQYWRSLFKKLQMINFANNNTHYVFWCVKSENEVRFWNAPLNTWFSRNLRVFEKKQCILRNYSLFYWKSTKIRQIDFHQQKFSVFVQNSVFIHIIDFLKNTYEKLKKTS